MDEARDFLVHYGIDGMRWGVRRYQNLDGSLTPAGKLRYLKQIDKEARRARKVQRIIRRGHRWEISLRKGLFTDEELNMAIKRLESLSELRNFKERKTPEPSVDKSKNQERAQSSKSFSLGKEMSNAASFTNNMAATAGSLASAYKNYKAVAAAVNEMYGYDKLPTFHNQSYDEWKAAKGNKKEQ